MGPADAGVVIVEFSDFQCPVCRGFAERLRALRARYPRDVAIVYRHWPLEYHNQAYPAARASECAGEQGKFSEMHDILFANQDSLGLVSWRSLASRAGVPDTAVFEGCFTRPGKIPEVERDIHEVASLNGTGTPTVLVNGEQYSIPPDSAGLEVLVRKARPTR
jgi:protein-disulfide isomerase